jgi:hypothetical protein
MLSCTVVHAARITIDSPPFTSPHKTPITVHFMLDPEKDTLSGMSGNFSFPTELFTLGDISTDSSVVSLWVKQPAVSDEKYLDGRTHITFEGIFPGGYDGVRSAYYQGVRPGVMFSVTLLPKNKGIGFLTVDDILLNAYNSEATPLKAVSVVQSIENPASSEIYVMTQKSPQEVDSSTLLAFISHDSLINTDAWYLMVHEREQKSSVESISVAETDEYYAPRVDEYVWHVEKVPYILYDQKRTKYVHVKVVYSNHTYTLRTLSPVENSQSIPSVSRILLSVALALLVLYVYVKYFFVHYTKQKDSTM